MGHLYKSLKHTRQFNTGNGGGGGARAREMLRALLVINTVPLWVPL